MPLIAQDLKQEIGSSVTVDRDELLSGMHRQHIMELLDRRGMLVFPNADLDDEEQLEFARTLGEVNETKAGGRQNIASHPTEDVARETVQGTFFWHMDGVVDEMPPRATILSPRKLSGEGGQTEYCNLYAAYDALDPEEKTALEGLRAVHDREAIHRRIHADPSEAQLRRWRSLPPRAHPLVWTHANGRRSLMIGTAAHRIEGMAEDAGCALLERLLAWATQPRFTYRHAWQPGDLVMWDNCGALHRVLPYDLASDRLMFRVTLKGQKRPA